MPNGVTPASLAVGHLSVLRNPDIAHVLYLRGLMEKLGRGSVMIQQSCIEQGLPLPLWSEGHGGVTLTFFAAEENEQVEQQESLKGIYTGDVTGEIANLLSILTKPMTRAEIQQSLSLKSQANFRERYLQPALRQGIIEMTIPEKPKSRLQKYRLTEKGRAWLGRLN